MKWWQLVLMWQGVLCNGAFLYCAIWMWITRHEGKCEKCVYVSLDKRWF